MRQKKIIIIFIILLSFILRLVNLNQSFWLDEAAQAFESSRGFWEQFDLTADFHPPLFHLMLYFWMFLGKSEIWIRLLSVFLSIGSIILTYKLASAIGKRSEGILASIFLAISPYHIWYSQEARPYMLFVFVSLLSTFTLIKKRWNFYILASILALYSHYFTIFLMITHVFFVFYFYRDDFNRFIKSILIVFLSYLFWLPTLINQLSVGTNGVFSGWTDVVSVSAVKLVPLTFVKFIIGKTSIKNNLIYIILIGIVLMIFLACMVRIRKDRSGKMLLILFYLPFAVSMIISFFIPVVAPQRLIFLLPFFYIILAKGIGSLPNYWKFCFTAIICCASILGLFQYYTNPYLQREQWREAVSFVEENGDDRSIALFVFPSPFASYSWYSKGKIEALGIAPKFIISDDDLDGLKTKIRDKNKVYLFQYLTGLTDPKGKARYYLNSMGYRELQTKDFPGVGFIYIYENRN